jgi:DNA primase small subunit
MDEAPTLILKRYFKQYYFKHAEEIKEPTHIRSREFGYFPFGGGMVRHLGFADMGTLRALLVKEAPAGVYCSNSQYEDPSAEMTKKGWLRAEFIFDIDADALNLSCKREHDIWICKECGRKEFGLRPQTCPTCKGTRLLEASWACPNCLEGTKKETFRLIEFLEKDFGIPEKSIEVYFSGNAGYHIHIGSTAFDDVDQQARAEISDYLTGKGLVREAFRTPRLSPNDAGWRGRIARFVRDLPPGSPPFKSNEYEGRVRELNDGIKDGQIDKMLASAALTNAVRIDAMVTTDIHRIFRMPETLNQKTGLVKRECTDNLSSFDPSKEAVALPDEEGAEEVRVRVEVAPRIDIAGKTFGPFSQPETLSLPLYAAVYLIAKGAAKVIEPSSEVKEPLTTNP